MIENGVITAESPVRLPLASIHTPISTIAVIIVKKAVRTHSAAARTFPDFFSRSARDGFSADTLWLNLILTFALMSTQRIIIISTSVNIPNNPHKDLQMNTLLTILME